MIHHQYLFKNLMTTLFTTWFGSFLLIRPNNKAQGVIPRKSDSLAEMDLLMDSKHLLYCALRMCIKNTQHI